jgi:hypothetical protein
MKMTSPPTDTCLSDISVRAVLAVNASHALLRARAPCAARGADPDRGVLTWGDNFRSARGQMQVLVTSIISHANSIGSGSESYAIARPRGPGGPPGPPELASLVLTHAAWHALAVICSGLRARGARDTVDPIAPFVLAARLAKSRVC